jgi:hypothetical protein
VSFANPKFQHLDQALAGHHDVGRLEVAMDDADGMRGRQRFRDLHGTFESFGNS